MAVAHLNPDVYIIRDESVEYMRSCVRNDEDDAGFKESRRIMKNCREMAPDHYPFWISSVRIEEIAGKMEAARKLVVKGCKACPTSEDLWLLAANIVPLTKAKRMVVKGLGHVPTSVDLWLLAVKLETEEKKKKCVLREALGYVPDSVRLWKAALELEKSEGAIVLLSRAVRLVPKSVDLWLHLARLQTYGTARRVLNKARENNPTDLQIWMAAAKLEESHGDVTMVDRIIGRSTISLHASGAKIEREKWLKEAADAVESGAVRTCEAIIKYAVNCHVQCEDSQLTWLEDAAYFTSK